MGSVIRVSQQAPSRSVMDEVVATLAFGGVVVVPTDSVYGIACAATPGNMGHERIFAIKKRDRAQTLPWLVAKASDLDTYARYLPDYALRLAMRYWPGALTLVVHASDAVPQEYRAVNGTIALRCPNSPLVRKLVQALGAPLATTSANTHGEAAAASGESVEPGIVEAVDLTLDAGPAPVGIASTIVNATGELPVVLREGAIPVPEIMSCIGAEGTTGM